MNDPDPARNAAARESRAVGSVQSGFNAGPRNSGRSEPEDVQRLESVIAEAELASAPADAPQPPTLFVSRERLLAVAAVSGGGFCGAITRYLVGLWAVARWGAGFPWGTLLINVSGSFILGLYLTLVSERFASRTTPRLFVAIGFLGAYTTFSTFSYEIVRLAAQGYGLQAIGYVAGSLVLGLAAAAVGMLVAHAM